MKNLYYFDQYGTPNETTWAWPLQSLMIKKLVNMLLALLDLCCAMKKYNNSDS